jgi:secondary thiamine-phosphate synthase enzyme
MKSYREFIKINTERREEIVDITSKVREICQKSEILEGWAIVFSHHTSSGVYLSDSDFSLTRDFQKILEKLVPEDNYEHDYNDYKRNATSHLKAILSGLQVIIPITKGKLDLGAFQTIYYAEFDGRREKEILVKILGY